MRAIQSLGSDEARRLRGLLFDLDDTLLDHGKLTELAYGALHALQRGGLELYVVTGRPLGWVEVLARLWPVHGGVGENGAALVVSRGAGVQVHDSVSSAERAARRRKLDGVIELMRRELSYLVPASDNGARLTDFTFDIGETQSVSPERVQAARKLAESHGCATLVSSVHLHIGIDRCDKAAGAVRLLLQEQGVDVSAALSTYAFIGDSENDAACFGAFSTTIGVANLRGRPTVAPRFVTTSERGRGFAEAAEVILARRSARP